MTYFIFPAGLHDALQTLITEFVADQVLGLRNAIGNKNNKLTIIFKKLKKNVLNYNIEVLKQDIEEKTHGNSTLQRM